VVAAQLNVTLSLAADIAVLKAVPRSKTASPRALASFTGERGEQCRKIYASHVICKKHAKNTPVINLALALLPPYLLGDDSKKQ